MNEVEKNIWIYGEDEDDPVRGPSLHWEKMNPEHLRQGIENFTSNVLPALIPLSNPLEQFSLEEVELSLTVSAKGKVGFLGTGAEANAGATIKVKLKRS